MAVAIPTGSRKPTFRSRRVVAVADVFDALTMKRPYKDPMPLADARRYLEDNKALQFDPACVDAFLSRWNEVVTIATAQHAMAPWRAEMRTLSTV
jgi:two-component system, response regulator RpfG